MRFKDLTNQKFGRLTVLCFIGRGKHGGDAQWLCRCDFGKQSVIVRGNNLHSGHTKSCGCWNLERSTKHGRTRKGTETAEYCSWRCMKARCLNPKHKYFKHYGARGISICWRWLSDDGFENFLADLGERPKETTLDRINVNGNYEPDNCRWAAASEQRRNQRRMVCSPEQFAAAAA
jgi:hypothetical protein